MKLDPKWVVILFVVALTASTGLIVVGKLPVEAFLGVLTTALGWLAVPPRLPNAPPVAVVPEPSPMPPPPPDVEPPPVTRREGSKP